MRKIQRNLLLAALIFAWLCSGAAAADPKPALDADAARQLFDLVNQERARENLPALEWDDRLAEAAGKHSLQMARRNQLSHKFDDEPTVLQRLADAGLHFDRDGENVAFDDTVEGAHQGLMHSPPHRANILSPDFTAVGIAVAHGGNVIYVTQDFIRRLGEYTMSKVEEEVAAAVARYRKENQLPPLKLRTQPELGQLACDMAAHDSLDTAAALSLPGVQNVVAYTMTRPEKLPSDVDSTRKNPVLKSFAAGACFAKSKNYPAGIYWVVLTFY